MTAAVTLNRPVFLTREASVFRLAFKFDPDLLRRVKDLPYATFDPDTKTWTTLVCGQSVQLLRRYYYEGLIDVPVDSLLADGETPDNCREAELRPGTGKRPFYVHIALRGGNTFDRLRSLPGASWEKKAQALSYPATSSVALAELVDRGVLDDPHKLLTTDGTVVSFDGRTGQFVVRGPDPRAGVAFGKHFPRRDVVTDWRARGLDVDFSDDFTREIYRGELARHGDGFQPDGLLMDLFPYQKRNVAVALERSGIGIYDEPGLGKTAQGIAAGFELLRRGAVTRTIVMVPASVRTQWGAEIVRFTGCSAEDVVIVSGDPKKRLAAYERAAHVPWLVIHYDVLSRDLKKLKPLFAGALVIADEAHRLKSYQAARTVAATTLCRSAARRIALTGTPILTNPGEFFQLLSGFAIPGVLGSPTEFNERYRYKSRWGYEGAKNIPELRDRTKVYYCRHTKAEVATHLPPLRVQQLVLDPDPAYAGALRRAHREAAEEIKADRVAKVKRGRLLIDQEEIDEAESGADMTAVGMLRLLCSSPRLVAESESAAAKALKDAGIVPDEDGPKLDELRVRAAEFQSTQDRRKQWMIDNQVAEATPDMVHGERFVVFSFSKRMANLISRRFTEDGVKHVVFTGDTSDDERDEAVRAFTDPNSDVIAFVATDAAAEGLNLGRCCSTLFNADMAWTAAIMAQRSQRIHRIDGTAPRYLVINLTLANTIEIGFSRLLDQRADLQDALFGEHGGRARTTGRRTKSLFEEAMAGFTVSPAAKQPVEDDSVEEPEPVEDDDAGAVEDAAPSPARPAPAVPPVGAAPGRAAVRAPLESELYDADGIPWPAEPVDDEQQPPEDVPPTPRSRGVSHPVPARASRARGRVVRGRDPEGDGQGQLSLL